jgi:hypothetical protein
MVVANPTRLQPHDDVPCLHRLRRFPGALCVPRMPCYLPDHMGNVLLVQGHYLTLLGHFPGIFLAFSGQNGT